MNKYLKDFETHSDYVTFTLSANYIKPNVSICELEDDVHYSEHDYSEDLLTFEILENGTITYGSGNSQARIWYCLNNGSNVALENGGSVTVQKGDIITWDNRSTSLVYDVLYGVGQFVTNIKFNVSGNIMAVSTKSSILNDTPYDGNFRNLFADCSGLLSAKHLILPANVSTNCYYEMFKNCTSLREAPALPATTLANYCYYAMFRNCTSLIMAPELPATELASDCYNSMFYGCTSLIIAPQLPATTLTIYCYSSMFQSCTSLTTAPGLPATTLASACYYRMFRYCTNLNSVTCLATDISATNCTINWLDGVALSGTFTKAASMTAWSTDVNGIPTGWTVQTASA